MHLPFLPTRLIQDYNVVIALICNRYILTLIVTDFETSNVEYCSNSSCPTAPCLEQNASVNTDLFEWSSLRRQIKTFNGGYKNVKL